MAIDTRNKRSSAIMCGMPFRGQYPAPDGSISAEDRSHIGYMFAFLSALPTEGVSVAISIVLFGSAKTSFNLHAVDQASLNLYASDQKLITLYSF